MFFESVYIPWALNTGTCVRLGEQSEKAENSWENLWNEIQLKRPKREIDTRTESKGVGELGGFMLKTSTVASPPREGEPMETEDDNRSSSISIIIIINNNITNKRKRH